MFHRRRGLTVAVVPTPVSTGLPSPRDETWRPRKVVSSAGARPPIVTGTKTFQPRMSQHHGAFGCQGEVEALHPPIKQTSEILLVVGSGCTDKRDQSSIQLFGFGSVTQKIGCIVEVGLLDIAADLVHPLEVPGHPKVEGLVMLPDTRRGSSIRQTLHQEAETRGPRWPRDRADQRRRAQIHPTRRSARRPTGRRSRTSRSRT